MKKTSILIGLLLLLFFFPPSRWKQVVTGTYHSLMQKMATDIRLGRINNPVNDEDVLQIKIPKQGQEKLEEYKQSIDAIKKYVKADIEFKGKTYACQLRIHGSDNRNWTGPQTSYRIKLNKEDEFLNFGRTFQLIKLDEANSALLAGNKLARSYNLISSYGQLVYVKENGNDKGVYYLTEAIDKTFLEREFGITNYAQIVNTNDWTRKEGSRHNTDLDLYHGHIEGDKGSAFRRALFQFKQMAQNEDPAEKYFDKKYLARFFSLFALFNDMGFIVGDNMKLIYNFDNGKFYPIFRLEYWGREAGESLTVWDNYGRKEVSRMNNLVFTSHAEEYENCETAKLFKRLLANREVRYMRDTMLFNMHSNKESVLEILNSAYQNNRPLLYHAEIEQFRKVSAEEQKQHQLVGYLLDYFTHYIKYAHVYGSYDKSKDQLELHLDAYVPITVIDTLRRDTILKNWTGILLGSNFEEQYNRAVLSDVLDTLELDDLLFINDISKDTLNPKHIHINRISSKGRVRKKDASDLTFLNKYNIRYEVNEDSLVILPGTYNIDRNNTLSAFDKIHIKSGVEFRLDRKSSLHVECQSLHIAGSEARPVMFSSKAESFGNISFRGRGDNPQYSIDNLVVDNGACSRWNGKATTGQFTIFNADVNLTNSIFRNSKGDDGLNLKFCKAEITNCEFYQNNADQVDLDFCIAKVSECYFKPSGVDANGDGLDFSGSYATVSNCDFEGFEDKSMSVGERSLVFIANNTFVSNNWSICAKDQSKAYAYDNNFKNNNQNYIGYIKKNMFAPPTIFGPEETIELSDTLQLVYEKLNTDSLESKLKRFDAYYEDFQVTPGLNHKLQVDKILFTELSP